jgi:hypothetical protein
MECLAEQSPKEKQAPFEQTKLKRKNKPGK